ncbi:hypothetical protein [Flavobacterium sp. KACC 22761]|uniref:hypothetical protein n=1 Tax=Flavobacterium sp. KACC 22761 TaxID=3092665 RepID=UPI002A74A0E8|nr:hypothetical protein [Flavobacterium sp. KACC 22761]WPO78019.1 hypothetical protein SCB73_17255 [Flavobacterium sp. KACC 22761]
MNLKRILLVIMTSIFLCCKNKPKNNQKTKDYLTKLEELVLSENNVLQEYIIKSNTKKETLEYNIIFIGVLKKSGVKVLHYDRLAGTDSPHLDSYLSLYSSSGEKLGKYYIGSVSTPRLENDNLIFDENYASCNQTTVVSFRDSIPKEIFIRCTANGGNLYGFEKEDNIGHVSD